MSWGGEASGLDLFQKNAGLPLLVETPVDEVIDYGRFRRIRRQCSLPLPPLCQAGSDDTGR